MAIEIFSRREQKYLITTQQYLSLVKKMSPYMRADKNGTDGKYTVTSLYFDSPDQQIYFETKNKLRFRQKLRLRVYDDATLNSTAFFEVKQKHNNVVNKRRMLIPLKEAYEYLNRRNPGDLSTYRTTNIQVFKEIDHFKRYYRLQPEMVVSYDRHAFHCTWDPDLRITFDLNLRCRNDDLKIENGPHGDLFVDRELVVMEVKVTHSVPLWLTKILQNLSCEQRSASKFCTSMELLKGDLIPGYGELEKIKFGGVE
ncbi:polyphosphate polymerase domain-containing protein [Jeotgalibacillus malaysiensis]|uniref:polyphosphate polymerase domain-containing protein n=1 Tax=Jeotgalibacillus malaysiensis TaxID=1508404 RepID=UPI00384CAFEC